MTATDQTIEEMLFSQADAFRATAVIVKDQIGLLDPDAIPPGGTFSIPLTAPQIVNSAFSVELYFKCLLTINGKQKVPRTHDLNELFKALPADDRQYLERYYMSDSVDVMILRQLCARTGNSPTFKTVITESAKAFVEYRYFHETRGGTWLAGGVREAARALILEKRPSFAALTITPRFLETTPTYPVRSSQK